MEVVAGINLLAEVLTTLTNAASQAQTISTMVQQAQSEGRTTFTDQEWNSITSASAQARQALVDAITQALLKKP